MDSDNDALRTEHRLALGAFLIPVMWVCVSFIYWPAVQEAGLLPPDGDTIMIPLFGTVIAAPFVIVLFLIWSWPAWRKARGRIDLFAWDSRRPIVSGLATFAYGGVAVLATVDSVQLFFLHPVERVNLLATIPFAIWNLLLRAAVVRTEPAKT